MRCIDCQNLISDYIDGALELGEQTKVEAHLSDCDACRVVRDDLLQIVHFSSQLPEYSPSSALWARIQEDIEIERPPIWRSKLNSLWLRLTSWKVRLSIAQMAASAAALVIVLSSAFLITERSRPSPFNKTDSGVTPPVIELTSNRDLKQIEDRINQLTNSIDQRKQSWDPELRDSYEKNLYYVDQSLIECQHQLKDNPTDDIAQELILNAYREKVRLLQGFERF